MSQLLAKMTQVRGSGQVDGGSAGVCVYVWGGGGCSGRREVQGVDVCERA
jgi:hypothetical protein